MISRNWIKFYMVMVQILRFSPRKNSALLDMFNEITSSSFNVDDCPSNNGSRVAALSPCNGCPLFEVCSDECAMNDANGYY